MEESKNGDPRKPPAKDPPPESAPPTQEQRDIEEKRRAVGVARAPAATAGAVSAHGPAHSGKGPRPTTSEHSNAGREIVQAVERNMETGDAAAKARARAPGGPASVAGAVSTSSRPEPTPPPARVETVASVEAPPARRPRHDEDKVVSETSVSYPPVASLNPEPVAGVEVVDHPDVGKAMDESYNDKEGAEVSPEAAVTPAPRSNEDDPVEEAPAFYPEVDSGFQIDAFVADTVVDATAVAVVMSEEEEEQFEQKRRKKYLCYGAIVLVVVAIAIVVPVVTVVGGSGDTVVVDMPPSIAPSEPPSAMPSAAPTSNLFSDFLDYLRTLPTSSEDLGENRSAPQYLAAKWLVDEDTYWKDSGLSMEDPKIIQRYALATLYFSSGGNNWKLCGKNSPSCGDTIWLTATDECEWFSLGCEESIVTQISFPATGNDLIGELPPEMSLLTGLKRFLVPENALRGDLDVAFAGLTSLETIAIPNNRLSGTVPSSIFTRNPGLTLLAVGGNSFTGPIPSGISAATKLFDLQLNQNQLTGTIPSEIGRLAQLEKFEVQTNKLVGTIPSQLYSLSKLGTVSIQENLGMNGTISPLISQLVDLSVLHLGFTGIGGLIPDELFSLTKLSDISFESASFSGTIPESFRRLNASLMSLFLNDNNFTGKVPEAFDHLTALETLQIQGNQLTGSISAAVCAERGLRFQQLATLIVDCVVKCTCCDNCEGEQTRR